MGWRRAALGRQGHGDTGLGLRDLVQQRHCSDLQPAARKSPEIQHRWHSATAPRSRMEPGPPVAAPRAQPGPGLLHLALSPLFSGSKCECGTGAALGGNHRGCPDPSGASQEPPGKRKIQFHCRNRETAKLHSEGVKLFSAFISGRTAWAETSPSLFTLPPWSEGEGLGKHPVQPGAVFPYGPVQSKVSAPGAFSAQTQT